MAKTPPKNTRKRKKKKKKLRWGRITATLAVLVGACWLAVYAFSGKAGKTKMPALPDIEEIAEIVLPSEAAAEATQEAVAEATQLAEIESETAKAPQRAGDVDLAAIFAESENPYDRHLPEMPDDGCVKMKINPIGGTLGRVFCDSNYLHLEAARQLGINPVCDLASAWHLRRPLVEVKSCAEYFVDDLVHSYPYLVPEAQQLLADIGRAFNDSLQARGGGSYRIKVTSVLRTPRTVGKLKRVNVNASGESAHVYGTTFDISYAKFICDAIDTPRTQEDLKNLLAEVLHAQRNAGRCYVKHERKQGCFHITARPNPQP